MVCQVKVGKLPSLASINQKISLSKTTSFNMHMTVQNSNYTSCFLAWQGLKVKSMSQQYDTHF